MGDDGHGRCWSDGAGGGGGASAAAAGGPDARAGTRGTFSWRLLCIESTKRLTDGGKQKIEILRLRLGLASYKLRTGQVSVPLADLQARPLPPPPASTVEHTPDNSQGGGSSAQDSSQEQDEDVEVVAATPPPAAAAAMADMASR